MRKRFYNILAWLSKHSKTDAVYIAEKGFWVLAAQIGATISALIVTVFLANLLDQETFGHYRFILAILPILALFTLQGIGTSMIRSIAMGNSVNFSIIAKKRMKWGILSSLTSLLFTAYYLYAGNSFLASAFLITAIFLPFYETFFIYSFYYKGRQEFKKSAIYESISRIVQAAILILIALISKSLLVLITTFFVGKLFTSLYFYFRTQKIETKQILKNDDPQDPRDDTIVYGKHLSLIGALGIITVNMDKIFAWFFLGGVDLAIYYIALVIPTNLVLLLNVLPRIAFPKFSQIAWDSSAYREVIRKLLIFSIALFIPAIIYVVAISWILPLMFHSYSASVPMAVIFSALIVISPTNAIIAQILRATKSIRQIINLRLLFAISFSVIFLLTYKSLDVTAVAITLTASELIILLGGVYLLLGRSHR
jgi:O-antigen/teichoic acid export membrane protein